MRHDWEIFPARSIEKIEMLQEDLLAFRNNEFCYFFAMTKLYGKTLHLLKNTL